MADGYSSRFQSLNAAHKDHIKHIHQNERMDMIARSKKLQQETNRRRKALVIKRKLESQREEKRRQEILHKRREQQRSATEKYQRLNKTFTPVSPRPASPHSHSTTPLLEEALRAVRGSLGGAAGGHARRSTYDGSASQGSASSSRASSASHVSRGRAGSASSTGAVSTVSGYSQRSTATNGTDSVNRGNFYNSQHHFNPPASSATLNARTAEHARQVAAHTELQSSSLRNLTNSRSRFEAQLEQHQHNLAEHQREALNQFNAAIRQEIDSDVTLHGTGDLEDTVTPPPDITRSESISSVDSLEEDAPDGKSTPMVSGSSSLQGTSSRFVPEKAGSDSGLLDQREHTKLAHGLHPSPSEGSLGNYYNTANGSGNGSVQEYQSTQNQAGGQSYGNMNASSFSRQGMVATNIPPGSTFMLHRSLSTGANVAVVQPISSANNSQTPNSVYANQYQKPNTATPQYTKAGAASNGNTNGYHYGQTQGGDTLKVAPGGGSQSSVQGKEGAVIGPLCSAQVSRVGTYFVDNTVNQVAQPSQNQFYLSNYNGTSYANNIHAANGDAHGKFTNDDFHARTKAWTSPSPHLTSPLSPTGQGGSAVEGDGGTRPFHLTSNTKPYSSRITATNTTLTTGSTTPVSTIPTNYAQNVSSAQQDNITNGNYGQQQAATNGQYVLHDTSSSQHTPQSVAEELASNTQQSYQTGTVYSKGSIPSTVIVSHQPPRPYNHHHHHHQNHNSTVGTTPAATATTSQPAPPEPTKVTTQEREPVEHSSEGEDEKDEEEQEEEDVEKIIKGILKPTYNPNQAGSRGRGRGAPARGGYTARLHQQGRGTGRAQPQAAVRDSLEITRDNIGQRIDKKSVRFAEKLVEERELVEYESPRVEPAVETTSSFVKPSIRQEKTSVRVRGKPPRPASARVTSTTPKVEVSVRESRSSSAGTLRRRPFVRHGAPKVTVSNQTPTNQETNGHAHHDNRAGTTVTTATTPSYNENSSNVTVPSPQKSNSDPVYDGNGLRLDRTPTDDEINWLWDKVRTCLKTSTAGSQDSQSQTTDGGSTNGTGRQPAAVASKYIDGNTLAPQFRTATRIQSNGNSMAATREPTINNNGGYKHGTGRKKVNMEHLSSYGRKNSGLLSQRKSTTQVQSGQGTLNTSQGANYTTYKPIYSTQAPSPVAVNNQNGDVTESMAAFLTAEALAQQSMSESQIESAMEEASQRQYHFNANKPYHKAPSAISQEEQRLLQSLERLNERLKSHVQACRQSPSFPNYSPRFMANPGSADTRQVYVYQNWTEGQQTVSGYRRLTETSVVGGGNYTGRPIPYSSGFRGHQPLSTSTRRHHSAGPAGAAARSQFRVGSAGGNIHTNHGGHVYYH